MLYVPTLTNSTLHKMQESTLKKLRLAALVGSAQYEGINYGIPGPANPPGTSDWYNLPNNFDDNVPYSTPAAALLAKTTEWTSSGGGTDFSTWASDWAAFQAAGYTFATMPYNEGILSPGPPGNGAQCGQGWTIGDQLLIAAGTVVGMAKNNTASSLPYFIIRSQTGFGIIGTDIGNARPICDSGVTYTESINTIYGVGILLAGQVIGWGQDVNLPFPDTDPSDFTDIGNTILVEDIYIPVIGIDPGIWFNHYSGVGPQGTLTTVTP